MAGDRAAETLRAVLDQLVMLDVKAVTIERQTSFGSVARVLSADGLHEVICEMDAEGGLRSARVIEL